VDVTEALDGLREIRDELRQRADDLEREVDHRRASLAAGGWRLRPTLTDVVTSHIVGRGLTGRSFTPGTGAFVRY
jgi:hypothetical protein